MCSQRHECSVEVLAGFAWRGLIVLASPSVPGGAQTCPGQIPWGNPQDRATLFSLACLVAELGHVWCAEPHPAALLPSTSATRDFHLRSLLPHHLLPGRGCSSLATNRLSSRVAAPLLLHQARSTFQAAHCHPYPAKTPVKQQLDPAPGPRTHARAPASACWVVPTCWGAVSAHLWGARHGRLCWL